jgi:succinoglycan biosynthesis protein ExoM
MQHIDVCVCTYKRPQCLKRLLEELDRQETNGRFSYSVIVVDNDRLRSAAPVVSAFANSCAIPIRYCVETQQSIPLARNKAVENAYGDYIAFIDDDEFPTKRWLLTLLAACEKYSVDGVLGPVRRHFDQRPPNWLVKGNFYEREVYPTGSVLDWRDGRTGNVLLKKHVFASYPEPFKPEFRGSEDTDFFRRMIERGHKFIWSEEAVAYEVVPPLRWKRTFMLRRALLRGAVALSYPTTGLWDILKSIIAVPTYALFLPFALMLGQHRFMDLLVRLCDHLGKLLALMGVDLVRGPYVTD